MFSGRYENDRKSYLVGNCPAQPSLPKWRYQQALVNSAKFSWPKYPPWILCGHLFLWFFRKCTLSMTSFLSRFSWEILTLSTGSRYYLTRQLTSRSHPEDVLKKRPGALRISPYGAIYNAKGCLGTYLQLDVLGTYSGGQFNHNP